MWFHLMISHFCLEFWMNVIEMVSELVNQWFNVVSSDDFPFLSGILDECNGLIPADSNMND